MLATAIRWIALAVVSLAFAARGNAATATSHVRLLYPSFAGSWAPAWVSKEAGFFTQEGLDVELIRVGGSTRMVAAMLAAAASLVSQPMDIQQSVTA